MADADDAVQETFVRAWKHLSGYEGRAQLRTWIYSIATRVCLDFIVSRGSRRLPSLDDSLPADPSLPPGAAEIAETLELSVPAVNSALQRARATLETRAPNRTHPPKRSPSAETDTLARYVRAWNTGDPATLAAALRHDAVLAMPPMQAWYQGRDAFVGFFSGFVLGLGLRFTLVEAPGTNGQRALASYREDPANPGTLYADALHVLSFDDAGAITSVMVFLGPEAVAMHGLPATREP